MVKPLNWIKRDLGHCQVIEVSGVRPALNVSQWQANVQSVSRPIGCRVTQEATEEPGGHGAEVTGKDTGELNDSDGQLMDA